MSISVSNVTKVYGQQRALDNVSFEIKTGEVVGFLGPNGAGKSTMMKILTCYLPATEGDAEVCGFDVNTQSEDVKRLVGYLPEHNPLYLDMYVREYLDFVGGIFKIPNRNLRINEIIDWVGLGPEKHKQIGQLSKGYRQRVGLAQALIHDPKVLILDEPTSGLDPNQLADIRDLIREVGREKTVMLSTHIMQEVEAMCDRVMIINRGVVVADDEVNALRRTAVDVTTIMVEFSGVAGRTAIKKINGVRDAVNTHGNVWSLSTVKDKDVRGDIFAFAVSEGLQILTLQQLEPTLEEAFKKLTAKAG